MSQFLCTSQSAQCLEHCHSSSATGDAAAPVAGAVGFPVAGIGSVVPEVHGENGLSTAEFPNLLIHEFSLLRGHHQLWDGCLSHGHIGEEPAELRALLDHLVKVFLAAHVKDVGAGVAGGDTEGQFLYFVFI